MLLSLKTLKKTSCLILVFIPVLLIIYFFSPRTSPLNNLINNLFEKYPQIRWQTRTTLSQLESPFFWLSSLPLNDELSNFQMIIDPKDLNRLDSNLPLAEQGNFLLPQHKKTVPAKLIFSGQEYLVKVRYRGDNYNHWGFKKKSWRIKLSEDSIDGLTEFNLIIPEDKGFIQLLFSLRLAHRAGLITPKAYFATLTVNQGNKQIYLLTQHWDENLIKQNQRFSNGALLGKAEFDSGKLYQDISSIKSYYDNLNNQAGLDAVGHLFELIQQDDETFFKELPVLVDLESTLTWIAHSTALFSRSQKASHNLVVYFNPNQNKLEFIPWDVIMFDGNPVDQPVDPNYNPLISKILSYPEWKEKRNQLTLALIGDETQLEEDLLWLKQIKNQIRPAVYQDATKLFLNLEFEIQTAKFAKRYQQAHQKLITDFHE